MGKNTQKYFNPEKIKKHINNRRTEARRPIKEPQISLGYV